MRPTFARCADVSEVIHDRADDPGLAGIEFTAHFFQCGEGGRVGPSEPPDVPGYRGDSEPVRELRDGWGVEHDKFVAATPFRDDPLETITGKQLQRIPRQGS